ncbi:MAG: flagellar export chaperone FlgN [Thermodesulfobacteriota bacterium]|nr:flagellar export chaperone FlgN [Thermodesulfobacteriota bacterium]
MEEVIIQSIEKLFYEKILLYNDLLLCFMNEREALINIDLDKLWRISIEKEETCAKIKSVKQEIISAMNSETDQNHLDLNLTSEIIPKKKRVNFQKLNRTLIKLKSEIEVMRKENMIHINESLHFLDEMISIITGEDQPGLIYNDKCHINKSGPNILLRREI